MTPMTIQVQVFGYLQGALQDSFFVYVRQVFTLARLPMASLCFMKVLVHVATSLCHTVRLANLIQPACSTYVVLTQKGQGHP